MRTKDGKGPMSDNGNSARQRGIPPNIEWDEDNPPVVYTCSADLKHDPNCDGTCDEIKLAHYETLLSNEAKEWARVGLDPEGIAANSLDAAMQVNAIRELLVEAGVLNQEDVDERYRKLKLTILQDMRSQLEPQIREAKTAAMLGVRPGPTLLGPHGEIL